MRSSLEQLLAERDTILADGAMGSRLFAAGLPAGIAGELWNIENPAAVREVHHSYIAAGAQVILTNSFGGSSIRLGRHDLAAMTSELNRAAAENARAEADAADQAVVVAGSIGPLGEMFQPFGNLDQERATAVFAEQAAALAAGGVDVLWIETMSDLQELAAAIAACRQAASGLPIVATMSFERRGRTMMGVTPEQAAQLLQAEQVLGMGANCGNGPDEIVAVIAALHKFSPQAVLVAKANAGMPRFEDGATVYDATPEEMAAYALVVREKGARIIGACCGSNSSHVAAMAAALES